MDEVVLAAFTGQEKSSTLPTAGKTYALSQLVAKSLVESGQEKAEHVVLFHAGYGYTSPRGGW